MRGVSRSRRVTRLARGQVFWGSLGVVVMASMAAGSVILFHRAIDAPPSQTSSAFPASTATLTEAASSVSVDSCNSPVQVVAAPVSGVEVTARVQWGPSYDPNGIWSLSGGELTVGDPTCSGNYQLISVRLVVPLKTNVTVVSGGGSVSVTGTPGAYIDSGNGPVAATDIHGPLNVTTGGGSLSVQGLTGSLNADTGNGPLNATDIDGPVTASTDGGSLGVFNLTGKLDADTGNGPLNAVDIDGPITASTDGGSLNVRDLTGTLSANTGNGPLSATGVSASSVNAITDGGAARLQFVTVPSMVVVSTDNGPAALMMPGGPYAVTANAGGGPSSVTVPTDPSARQTITVTTDGGSLTVQPASQ
jgi:DUF4097 and DUF4098 domain-containing protein YvlB